MPSLASDGLEKPVLVCCSLNRMRRLKYPSARLLVNQYLRSSVAVKISDSDTIAVRARPLWTCTLFGLRIGAADGKFPRRMAGPNRMIDDGDPAQIGRVV